MPKLEHKLIPLQIKAVNVEESTFEGFSAGIGNLDDGNDRLIEGAFTKTIRERVEAGKVKFLDHHAAKNPFMQSSDRLWGTVIEAEEYKLTPKERKELAKRAGRPTKDAPSHALLSLTKVSKAQPAQDALVKIGEGILDALSIGYIPTSDKVKFVPFKVDKKKGGKKSEDDGEDEDPRLLWLLGRAERQLHEVAWWEHSAVIWGQNPFALTLPGTVKELKDFADQAAERGLGDEEAKEVREVIEALQALSGGCPTKAAVEAMLPKIEKLARTLEEMADWEAVQRLEGLANAYAKGEVADDDKAAVSAFVSWAAEGAPAPEKLDGSGTDVTTIADAALGLVEEIQGSLQELEGSESQAAEEPPAEGRPGNLPTEEELENVLCELELINL